MSNASAAAPLRRVLVIEDEDDVAEILCGHLRREECDVRRAATARQVTDEILDWADAAVVDLVLPDSGARATVERIAGWRHRIGLFVVSGHADKSIARSLGDLGIHLIVKPFDPLAVSAAVRAEATRTALSRRLRGMVQHLESADRVLCELRAGFAAALERGAP